MRVFEFQFNPQAKEDRFLHALAADVPEAHQEAGSLYLVGELSNALPGNASLVNDLFTAISDEYYKSYAVKKRVSVNQRLKIALKKGNDFLAEETKKGNVDWLGNLHVLLLLFVPGKDGYTTLYFSKTGKTQLWMARAGSLVDAGKNVERNADEEASPKIFGRVGSGRLLVGDRIIALTQELFDFLSKENFLQTIAQLKEEKQFKQIFKTKHKEMGNVTGVFLFMLVDPPILKGEEPVETQDSSFKLPISFSVPSLPGGKTLPALPKPNIALPKAMPNLSLPKPSSLKLNKKLPQLALTEVRKRTGILALFILVLFIGFTLLNDSTREKTGDKQNIVLSELTDEQKRQYKIFDIENIEPAVVIPADFETEQPQKAIVQAGRLYAFGPHSPHLLALDISTEDSEVFDLGSNPEFGTEFATNIVFFAEPKSLIIFNITTETASSYQLSNVPANAEFEGFAQYAAGLYFLDTRAGNILRSPIPPIVAPVLTTWLEPTSSRKPVNAQSIGIDGNIWILNEDNEIQRYFRGMYEESLNIDIVPEFQNIKLVKTNNSVQYIYLLEPAKQRVVVVSKSGALLAQYRSPAFANARDMDISADGQTIYVFDGTNLYEQVVLLP